MSIQRDVLVGADAAVIGSSNPSYLGICGVIVDETANMLVIEDVKGATKRLIKKNVILKINGICVDGESIVGRPDVRIKMRINKRWR